MVYKTFSSYCENHSDMQHITQTTSGKKSYLYLPSSEKRLIQGHGCPNRLFVCKLNIGKPAIKQLLTKTHTNAVKEMMCLLVRYSK